MAFAGKIVAGLSCQVLAIGGLVSNLTAELYLLQSGNRAIVPAHVLIRHLDGESVLLNLETERYFGLDGTGTRMLDLLTASPNVDSAYHRLLEEFEVEPALLREHLNELLGRLVDNGLLNLLPADVATTPAL